MLSACTLYAMHQAAASQGKAAYRYAWESSNPGPGQRMEESIADRLHEPWPLPCPLPFLRTAPSFAHGRPFRGPSLLIHHYDPCAFITTILTHSSLRSLLIHHYDARWLSLTFTARPAIPSRLPPSTSAGKSSARARLLLASAGRCHVRACPICSCPAPALHRPALPSPLLPSPPRLPPPLQPPCPRAV